MTGPAPHDVLGIPPDATPEEIAQAYRELAKRHHPDLAGSDAAPRMQEINAAYDLLRDGLADQQRARVDAAKPRPDEPPPPPPVPGHWLEPTVRRMLGRELLASLQEHEEVVLTADCAMSDAFDVRMVVTDRRLLWLRDDAISDRVRWQAWARVARVEGTVKRRIRRLGQLRVTTDTGRTLTFGELDPARLDPLVEAIAARLRA